MDKYQQHQPGLESPAIGAFSITPDDTAPLSQTTRSIYIGNSGDLTVIMKSGEQVTFSNLPAGIVLPIRVQQIMTTGTTASQIIGLV